MEFVSGYHVKDESCIKIQKLLQNMGGSSTARDGGLVGRSYFLSTVEMLTHGKVHRKRCVDYFIAVLLYANVVTIWTSIQQEVVHSDTRLLLEKKLTTVMECVKLVYYYHIGMDVNPFHDGDFSIVTNRNDPSGYVMSKCKLCLTPFQVLRDTTESIPGVREDVSIALLEARRKIHIFVGHRMRRTMQENRLVSLFRKVKESPPSSMGALKLDYKMKFGPL